MKKQSKNLGITKCCPACKKTLIKEIDMNGEGKLKCKCPHCKELILIEIKKKVVVNVIKVAIVILIVMGVLAIRNSQPQYVQEIQQYQP